jgi:hypothetical protein
MLRKKNNSSMCLTVLAAALLILSLACGSGSSSSTSNSMSQAQAQAVSTQIFETLEQALGTVLTSNAPPQRGARPSLPAVLRDFHPDESSGCVSNANGETCNYPVSYSGTCPGGGTISVAGDFDGTVDNSGNGSVGGTLTVTPDSCSVSNLTINGDPNITVATQVDFTDSNIVYPVSITETGGISYGPNPSGSCQLNVTYTVASTGSCTITGTLCGQSVSGTC